jgi:RNA polymerase sigma-70 factor (ECF subfamily)
MTAAMSRPVRTRPPIPAEGGQTRPFDAVYREFARVVARWAARLGGPAVSVDDVVQDVFLVVSRRLGEFRGDSKLTTWLFRITDKVVRNARRQRRRRRWLARLTTRIAEAVPAPQPTPLEQRERREAEREFYRILDELPEKQRKVLVLHELEAMGTGEIAELLGMKVATVRVALHRARSKFLERVRR